MTPDDPQARPNAATETSAPPAQDTGFRARHGRFEEGTRLPNLEDPSNPVQAYGQIVTPVGFGFTSPNWQPRASFAGTFDECMADPAVRDAYLGQMGLA